MMKLTLPKCESCGLQLTWKQAFRAQRFFYEFTHCPICKEKQFIAPYKKVMFLTILLSVSPLIIKSFINLTLLGSLTIYAVILPILLIASPFVYSLKSQDPRLPIKAD